MLYISFALHFFYFFFYDSTNLSIKVNHYFFIFFLFSFFVAKKFTYLLVTHTIQTYKLSQTLIFLLWPILLQIHLYFHFFFTQTLIHIRLNIYNIYSFIWLLYTFLLCFLTAPFPFPLLLIFCCCFIFFILYYK